MEDYLSLIPPEDSQVTKLELMVKLSTQNNTEIEFSEFTLILT
jgi:hypothetical protein